MDFFKQKFNSEKLQEGQIFLINKPMGWTSFQVVNKIRWHLKNTTGLKKLKVGHAGTLDPLATGLLLICTGKKTKIISTLQDSEKEYTGTFKLGATTPSFDLETEIDKTFNIEHITRELIENTTKQFLGRIQQRPPLFSALKKDGKRLYEYARSGKAIDIAKRNVTIFKFKITKIELPNLYFLIRCSKGTYIRSLAYDFGKAISSGAHLSALQRTQSGGYELKDAYTMESVLNNNSHINIKSK